MRYARLASPRVRLGTVLALLAGALPAAAWDRDQHVAIVRAAIGISVAAEEHLPLEYRDALYKELAEADFLDKDCRYHPSDTGPKEPALVAEQLLAQILAPKMPMKPYQRAQAVGRYLHYVADAVAPASLRRDNATKLLNFFANRDFVFYREHRGPLGAPLSAALRKRAEEMVWANGHLDSTVPAMWRCVVNAVADAILLLPAREGAAGRDEGPVYFLVNRIDSGTAGKATEGHWAATHEYGTGSFGQWWVDSSGGYNNWSWDPGTRGGGDSFKKANLMERQGVQLVELITRQEKDRVLVRGLFFNNNGLCASGVGLKAGAWSWSPNELLPPQSLLPFETTGPADLLSRRLTVTFRAAACEGPTAKTAISALNRMVVGNGGDTPRFEYAAEAIDVSSGPKRPTSNMTPKN